MNVLSLFTGVGGFDLGLERAGHTIVGQVEWDKKCQAILRKHWPSVPLHGDITTCDEEWLSQALQPKPQPNKTGGVCGEVQGGHDSRRTNRARTTKRTAHCVDLVCGGFPCQDLSVAGKRAGLAGERSGLFHEAVRIADFVLDTGGWVLIENVPGLLSSNGGRDFGIVLASLADRGFHDLAWRVLDSRYFGVPQRRRRVFILARRASGRRAAEVLLEPEGGGGDFAEGQQAGKDPARRAGNGVAKCLTTSQERLDSETQDLIVSHTLTARHDSGPDGTGRGTPIISCPPPDSDRVRTPPGIPRRVDDPVTAFHATQTPIHSTDHSPCLGSLAQIGVMGSGNTDTSCPYDPKPDAPRYHQMGNAVTVPVAEWIGHRLREFA